MTIGTFAGPSTRGTTAASRDEDGTPIEMIQCTACKNLIDGRKPTCASVVDCNEADWKRQQETSSHPDMPPGEGWALWPIAYHSFDWFEEALRLYDCALIETWRPGWPEPLRQAPDDYPAMNAAGLWWRPVDSGSSNPT